MHARLIKTLLTQKVSSLSIIWGLISFGILFLIFQWEQGELSASGKLVFEQGQYWKAFTTTFVHGDFNHLIHNSVFFIILAALLNNYFGFWVYPVVSLISGGIINLIVLKTYPSHVYLVGISGVNYFMAGVWLTLFLLIERKESFGKRLIVTLGMGLIFLMPELTRLEERVSYLAHSVGFFLGVPFALAYFYFKHREIRTHEVWEEKAPVIDFEEIEKCDNIEECANSSE